MSANRPQTGKRPAPRTAFRPGQSGNPSGRPKRTAEEFRLIQACQTKSQDALATITQLMTQADKDSVRLSAAVFIIERAYGKPVAKVDDPNSLAEFPLAFLKELRDLFQERAALEETQAQAPSAGTSYRSMQGRA